MQIHRPLISTRRRSLNQWFVRETVVNYEMRYLGTSSKTPPFQPTDTQQPQSDVKSDLAFNRIRCPLCQWRPRPEHRWFCAPCAYPEHFIGGCSASWNTFTTGGRCPGCGHQWRWTVCLNCAGWSLHQNWYDTKPSR